MSFGLSVFSSAGRVQIDQDYINARLVSSGYVSTFDSPSGYYRAQIATTYTSNDVPIVLIKPSAADQYVGGLNFYTTSVNGANAIVLYGKVPFYYAIFNRQGTPINDGSTHGLQVFRSDGSIAYTSQHSHPRITALRYRAPAANGFPATQSVSLSAIPWFLANSLIWTLKGVGEESSTSGAVMAKINAALNTVTFELMNIGSSTQAGPLASYVPATTVAQQNPYENLPAWLGVCDYA